MFKLVLEKSVINELDKIGEKELAKISIALKKLQIEQRSANCKKLKGLENIWRVRIGDYRIVYEIEDKELIIIVLRVRHRKDVYR